MGKEEWKEWVMCNLLEIIILILVLSLVIHTFSKEPTTQEKEVPATEKEIGGEVQKETPLEGGAAEGVVKELPVEETVKPEAPAKESGGEVAEKPIEPVAKEEAPPTE